MSNTRANTRKYVYLLSSRLYCRLRNLTESALMALLKSHMQFVSRPYAQFSQIYDLVKTSARLVGCTTGREFNPALKIFI